MSTPRSSASPFHAAVTCFSVLTDAEPSALARVVEVFAMRSMIPARFHSVLEPVLVDGSCAASIDIQVAGLAPADVAAIARKLSCVIGVRSVATAERAAA